MRGKTFSKHIPAGGLFDASRLSPPDAARSLTVWKSFISTQLALLRTQCPVPFSIDSDCQIVCHIDRRSPTFEFVLLNSMMMLGDKWGLQIVTKPELEPWIMQHTHALPGVEILPVLDYGIQVNELRRSVDFWKKIKGEFLLLIDAESIICHRDINRFLEYDYVAPLWRRGDVSPWCRYGGGISMRRKSAMIKICNECNVNPVLIPNESIFFSMMFRLQSNAFHLPDDSVASKFAVERCYYDNPFALHKAWKFIPYQQLQKILDGIEAPEQAV